MHNFERAALYAVMKGLAARFEHLEKENAVWQPDYQADPKLFESACVFLQKAHAAGFTIIRETVRDNNGATISLLFEQLITPAGEAFLAAGAPPLSLSKDSKDFFMRRLRPEEAE